MRSRLRLLISFLLLCGLLAAPLLSVGQQARRLVEEGIVGRVEDAQGRALAEAIVTLPGSSVRGSSDASGHFRLPAAESAMVTPPRAWAPGFYIGAGKPAAPSRLVLQPLPSGDHDDYVWQGAHRANARAGQPVCASCHDGDADAGREPRYRQWAASPHANAAGNPFFLALYAGQGEHLLPGVGYRADFPQAAGSCAACHAPLQAVAAPNGAYGADPRQASGVAKEGVSCDFCHKVAAVKAEAIGLLPGVLALRLQRPPPGVQLTFGPLVDALPDADSYSPAFADSRLCAACHQQRSWNQTVYGEFEEWQASPAAARGEACQHCHMPTATATRRLAPAKEGALLRPASQLHDHRMAGRDDVALLQSAVALDVRSHRDGDSLRVEVRLKHRADGHRLPSGSPLRQLLLLVDARDSAGRRLAQRDGERLPSWAGSGSETCGNYAGLPGKGYAKIFVSPSTYPDSSTRDRWPPLYPAPWWRPLRLESDNRLMPGGEDVSVYTFNSPGAASVRVRLLHRRAFRGWFAAQQPWPHDVTIAEQSIGEGS